MQAHELKAIDIVASALDLPHQHVTLEDAIGTLAQWNSIAHLKIVLEMETRMCRMLSPEEIIELTSVRRIAALLETTPVR